MKAFFSRDFGDDLGPSLRPRLEVEWWAPAVWSLERPFVLEPGHTLDVPLDGAAAFEGATESEVEAAIEALRARYSGGQGGLTVEQVAGAFRLATKPEVGALVRQFFRQRNRTRLSPAGLETLVASGTALIVAQAWPARAGGGHAEAPLTSLASSLSSRLR